MRTYWCPVPDDPDRVVPLTRPQASNTAPVADRAIPGARVPEPVRSRLAHPPTEFAGLGLDRPRIMGIINVTPDSFSDGGDRFETARAIADGLAMREAGAEILDVGGESTRPGAEPISEQEEMDRVLPVIEGLVKEGLLVSIDSRHAAVMGAALDQGAAVHP